MLGKFFKKITGVDKLEKTIADAESKLMQAVEETAAHQREAERARQEAEKAKEAEELSKLSPKERATRKKESWVGVLNTHVNEDNIRNGFLELDWNEYFVLKLKQEGYGSDGDPDEEIVDRWFRELCANVVVDGDYGGPIDSGSLKERLKKEQQ
jgi:uncharacterized membrane-anchored protein